MEIQSRLLTVDFYDCKGDQCSTEEALRDQVSDALRTVGLSPMRHVSLDVYLCRENVPLDPIAHVLRKFFQPDKIKSTHLRRGDFRTPTEIRPKTTTRVAPIRKIKSTGAKVIRILARRNRH